MKTLLERSKELPDYRKYKIAKYNVGEVIYLSLLAMLAGANGYEDMALWIKLKRRELSKILGHGLIPPAYTTIRNV
ncbi:MAG TPA: transposase family protein, partial [Campylobacterales bacterium]|nr:transposase family protein [Campylobacterales bacterium]